jgi:hypothetical protein
MYVEKVFIKAGKHDNFLQVMTALINNRKRKNGVFILSKLEQKIYTRAIDI